MQQLKRSRRNQVRVVQTFFFSLTHFGHYTSSDKKNEENTDDAEESNENTDDTDKSNESNDDEGKT